MSYSIDLRCKILSIREKENLSIREIANCFHIGSASITRWLSRIEVKPFFPRRRKLDKEALAKDVELYLDAYQRERAARFGVCQKTIWQALKNLGVTYKKTLPTYRRRAWVVILSTQSKLGVLIHQNYLILASLYRTCLRMTGSNFLNSNLSGQVRLFFVVV